MIRDYSSVDAAIASTDPADIAFERLYGPWQSFTIAEVAEALASYQRPWWVCGGVALEAFTGVVRRHDDLDIGFFASDLGPFCRVLGEHHDVWSAGSGMLRPIDLGNPQLHEGGEQVWIREHAWAPWKLDALATPGDGGRWVNKREPSMALALDEATWTGDGVRYLAPELVLLMKAAHTRPKDDRDFQSALPMLGDDARHRLAGWLAGSHPGHPWLAQL